MGRRVTVGRPELSGDVGAVASTHWLATGAAMAVLERGGNAADAATAAGFVLQVVEPHSNGLGGDVSIVVHSARNDTTRVVCGQGPMPIAANLDHFHRLGLRQIPGSGLLPATVPGAFGAWMALLAEFGTLTVADVMEAGIACANRGYPVTSDAAIAIKALEPLFRDEWTGSASAHFVAGAPPSMGARATNPRLGETMARLVRIAGAASADREGQIEAARAAFYEGFVAEAIGAFVRSHEVLDSTGRRHRGLLTADDLASWRAEVEVPTSVGYRDLEVHKPGPWSQGPVLLQQLAVLEHFDLRAMDPADGQYVHVLTEAAKLAFADREAWYGDPNHVDVPIEALLDPTYTAGRVALIGDTALTDPRPGEPNGRRSFIPSIDPDPSPDAAADWMNQLQSGMPTIVLRAMAKPSDTCAVVVADGQGNLVSAVPSGGWLKSSPVIAELGFPLGTRGQTMWLVDGHPNTLVGGKRPRSTLSPSVVLRDGAPYLAFGTPGGDRQDQWTLETMLAIVEHDLDFQAATEVPTFHTDHFPASFTPRKCRPGVLVAEGGFGEAAFDDLRRRGHDLDVVPPQSMGGKVCIVGVDGFLRAGAGPRGRQAHAACR